SEVESPARVLGCSGKTVQNSAEAGGCPLPGDKCEAIFPGIFAIVRRTAMDDDGKLGDASQFQLLEKTLELNFPRRMIVKIVQPDFAPRDHFRMPRPLLQLRVSGLVCQDRFVRMDADTCPDLGIFRLA